MALLSADGIVVQFGGLRALADTDVDVEAGRVTGLIGPNGAGKTTLFNVITGLQPPTAGRVLLDGKDITGKSPYKRARLGIARTFQKLEAFTNLSARNNVRVAAEQRRAWDRSRFDPSAVTDELLERIGLSDVAEYMVGVLPTGTARLVELARALATNPRVLLLDEPSSGLNVEETDDMSFWIRDIRSELGITVLMVEHDMSLVNRVSDRVLALNYGKVLATGTPAEVQAHPDVIAAYLGA